MSSALYWKLFKVIDRMLSIRVEDWPRSYIHAIRFGWEGSEYQEMLQSVREIQDKADPISMTNLVYISAHNKKRRYKHPVKTALSQAFKTRHCAPEIVVTKEDNENYMINDTIFISDILRLNLDSQHTTIIWMLYNDYSITDICDYFCIDRGYLRKLKGQLTTILQKDFCG